MSADRRRGFSLAGQGPREGPGVAGSLFTVVRRVEGLELERALEASEFVNRLSGADPYARLVELVISLGRQLDAVGQQGPPPARVEELVGGCHALCTALIELAPELRGHVAEVVGAGAEELALFAQALAEETGRDVFRVLSALPNHLRAEEIAIEPAQEGTRAQILVSAGAVTAIEAVTEVEGLPRPLSCYPVLLAGVVIGQRLLAHELQILERRLRVEATALRKLAAEVFGGWPILLEHDLAEEGEGHLVRPLDEEPSNFTVHQLPLDKVQVLLGALEAGRELLAQPAPSIGVNGGPQDHLGQTPGGENFAGGEDSDARDAGEPEVTDVSEQSNGEDPHFEEHFRDEVTVDFGSLVDHVVKLSHTLEERWSQALDPDDLHDAHERMRAEWASLTAVLQRRAEAGRRALEAAGLSAALEHHPFDPAVLKTVEVQPAPQERWKDLQIAEILSLAQLTETMEGLFEPSRRTVGLDGTGSREETWWESGAFALVRVQATALARISRDLATAENAAIHSAAGGETDLGRRSFGWFNRLLLARAALVRGDAEACVLHLRLTLRERVGELSTTPSDELPPDIESRLALLPELAELAPALRLLGQVGLALAAGRHVELGPIVTLAFHAYNPIAELCMSLSSELAQGALAEGIPRENNG